MSWFWKPCDEELAQNRWIESLRHLSRRVRVARDKKGLTRASPVAHQYVAIECFVEIKSERCIIRSSGMTYSSELWRMCGQRSG